jgi:hypothetical protein
VNGPEVRTARNCSNVMLARYENSAGAQAYLSGQTAKDLRPLLALRDMFSYPGLGQLADCVRFGLLGHAEFME